MRRRLPTAEKSKNMPLLYLLPHKFVQIAFQGKNEIHVARAAEAGDIQFEYLPFKGKTN